MRDRAATSKRQKLVALACAAGLSALALPAAASAGLGVPDPTFGSGGLAKFELGIGNYSPASSFDALGFGPDGTIYAAGVSLDSGGTFEMLTARLTEGGELDPSFAGSGWVHNLPVDQGNVLFDEYVRALSAEAAGVVVGGNAIERFTAAGQFDNGFAPNQPPIEIEALSRLADGDLLESGHRSTGETRAPAAVEGIHADGSPDTGFGEGGLALVPLHAGQYSTMTAHSAVQLADGDLLVAGSGSYALMGNESEHPLLWLARLTPSGAIDTSFGEGGVRYIDGYGKGFIAARSGGLALLGTTVSGEAQLITAWGLTAAGEVDASFGSGGVTVIPAAAGYDTTNITAATGDTHGRLLAVGEESNTSDLTVHAPERPAIVRLEANGQLDSSFGEGGLLLEPPEADLKTIAVDGAGRILVGGSFDEKYGENRTHTYSFAERLLESLPPASPGGAPPAAPVRAATRVALTRAEIAKLLHGEISPRACHASVRELRKRRGCSLRLRTGRAGTALLTWYVGPAGGAHVARSRSKRLAIARGRIKLSSSGAGVLKLRLTRAGIGLMRHERHVIALSAVASFSPVGQRSIRVTARSLLRVR